MPAPENSPKREEKPKKAYRYNFKCSDYLYEQTLSPNHVHLWLALCLHADTLDKTGAPLKLGVPDTLVYGFGKNPIWLFTDERGAVSKKLNDECSEENIFTSFSGEGIIALDKEPALVPCANPAAEFDGPPTVRFDGTYISPLTAPSLRRLLLKPKQHPPRVFSIQKVLATKYGDHSTSIRVSYAKGGKCSVWSMTRREPFIVKTMSPLKQRRAETMTAISSARPEDAPVTHTLEEPPTAESPMRRIRQLRRLDTVLGSMEDQPSPASLRHQSSNLFFVPGEEMGSPLSSPSKRVSVSEQNIEDITNLYDDNNAVCNEEPKRFLDSLSEQNCLIDEMTPLAAEPIFDIVANIARHYSNVFRRTMEQLTIDVAKDANDCYCLVDIVAFRFEDCDIAPAKLPTRIKTRIEIECDCILDAFRSHLDPAQVHAALIMEGDAHEGGTKASKIDWNAQAVGAAPCSMCESKLPPDQLCYAITSTLIQSTIIHMRSRLPQKYWPNFCRDNCFAVRSMNRIEGDPFNIKGLTVADIRICSLCYEICNKEMALVEIEQKLSKFTRTTKERSVDQRPEVLARSATAASIGTAKETLLDGCSTMSPPKPNVVPNPIAKSDWNPTENFRMRNRPSVLVKIAAALDTSKKLNKQASEPVLKPKRMTVGPGDLKMAPNSRPRSAGLARTPNHPSPIRRHDSSQQIPSVSAATGATPSKSMASTGRITRMRKLDQEEHIPAQGRSVVRSSLNENMTMCRALVGIQQVKDLPVIIFEHFENFRVYYNMLGRDISFPAFKKSKYYRKDAYRYKTFTVGGENDSVSLSSNGSDGEGSDFDDVNGEDFRGRGSGVLSKVDEEDGGSESNSSSGDQSSEENVSIVVGTLGVQRMRVGYAMIPGNSAAGSPSQELECYFAKNRKILIVLCGDVKEGVNIHDESRWLSPPEGFSSVDKSMKLQHCLTNIRLDAVNKTLFKGQYSSSNDLRQKHLSRLFRKSYKDVDYVPKRVKKTEAGEVLPEGAIAYGYVNFYQFLNATVNRVDVIAPMTYALTHVPRERSVPMLKAVVGFERLFSPVDILSLPYSLVNIGHSKDYEAYVAELEDQLSSSEPLPAEWLVTGAQDDTSSSRRKAVATFLQLKSVQESASAMMSGSRLDVESDVLQNAQANEFANNVIDGKRNAPIKFPHEARSERIVLNKREEKAKSFKDEEELKERSPNSLWCFSAHIVSGHHMGASIPENVKEANEKLTWMYKFKFLNDTISANCTTENKYGFDEVAALEDMFSNMEPVDFELRLLDEAEKDAHRQSKIIVRQKASGIRDTSLLVIPNEDAFRQRFTGSFSLNEFKTQRFFETTILMTQHVDVGVEKCIYPAYLFAEFHIFRMGDGSGSSMSIPNHLAVGREVVPGVRKVVKKHKLHRVSSFTPAAI